MKNFLFCCLIASVILLDSSVRAQSKVSLQSHAWSTKQLGAYFKINARLIDYQGQQHASIHPALCNAEMDTIASFMHQYHRRFEYLLQNKTAFNDLTNLYPDSVRINEIYVQRLIENSPFLTYLSQLLEPVHRLAKAKQTSFKQEELMLVASRFFLCDQIRPDTTVSWHVCIGLNGIKDANWLQDYTLLEAFCFEAIFDKMFSRNSEDTRYMNQFLDAIEESTRKRRPFMKNKEQLLDQVKIDVFAQMQSDPVLRKHLLDYYNQHSTSLPFRITPD